jgi:hypothetical protein
MAGDVAGRRRVATRLLAGVCLAVVAPTAMRLDAQQAAPAGGMPSHGEAGGRHVRFHSHADPLLRNVTACHPPVGLSPQQRRILDDARRTLKATSLTTAEQQVRLCAVEAAMTGTVGGPDEDNPEVRNPNFWTLSPQGYVAAGNRTAVEAIDDLWTVHQRDGVPVPRIWCYEYSLLVMTRAHIQYFHNAHSDAGLAAMCRLLGHKSFPDGLPNEGEGVFWKTRRSGADLLPGDQVWFENPYYARGRELIRPSSSTRSCPA